MAEKALTVKTGAAAASLILLLAAGALSCTARTQVGEDQNGGKREPARIKRLFAAVGVPARVELIEDAAVAANSTNTAMAWITRSAGGDSRISVAVFDNTGRKTAETDLGPIFGPVHSAGVGFDGAGDVVVSWRATQERRLNIAGSNPRERADDLYLARVAKAGGQLAGPTAVKQAISNIGWRGPSTGWDKILTRPGGGFTIGWYSSNTYRLEGEDLVPVFLGDESSPTGRAPAAKGDGWVVYEGDPTVRYQRFNVDGVPESHPLDVPVGTRPAPANQSRELRHLEALDTDKAGNVYSVTQEETGPGRTIKGGSGAKTTISIPVKVSLTRTDVNLRPAIGALPVADSAVNAERDRPPGPWLSVSEEIISVVWPKAKSTSQMTHWLRQYTLEGMVSGPEVEVDRGFEPGLQAPLGGRLAVARSSGADLMVDFFATGSRLFDLKIAGANQGRIGSYDNDLIAIWLGAGSQGEELQVGRWRIAD